MPGNVEILRNDAPRCAVLKDAGWRIVGTSWGARLHLCEDDWPRLGRLVSRVEGLGYQVIELSSADAEAVHALEGLTQPDYPRDGPATAHPLLSEAEVTSLFDRGRVFGRGSGLRPGCRDGHPPRGRFRRDRLHLRPPPASASWRGPGPKGSLGSGLDGRRLARLPVGRIGDQRRKRGYECCGWIPGHRDVAHVRPPTLSR